LKQVQLSFVVAKKGSAQAWVMSYMTQAEIAGFAKRSVLKG